MDVAGPSKPPGADSADYPFYPPLADLPFLKESQLLIALKKEEGRVTSLTYSDKLRGGYDHVIVMTSGDLFEG